MILYHLTDGGGFLCGDLDRGIADYAYPTSEHAERARREVAASREPAAVAREMLAAADPAFLTTPELRQRNADRLAALRLLSRKGAA